MTTRHNTTKRVLLWGGLCIFLAVAVVAGLAAADRPTAQKEAAQQRAIPVEVVEIQPVREFEERRSYTGTIEALRTSDLGFERAGRLINVLVHEGDAVYQGQQLAHLDVRHLQARQKQLQAQRQEASALLDEYLAGPRKETIAAARANVADLKSQYEHADATHQRNEDLNRKKVISKEDYDRSAFGVKSANARLDSAQRQLDELLAGTRKEKIASQRAAVAQLDASLADLDISGEMIVPSST